MKHIYFVLGGPASGKTTFCGKLSEILSGKILSLSAGALLREHIRMLKKTPESSESFRKAKMIEETCMQGKIVPSQVTIDLLTEKIRSGPVDQILIDGFPRNLDNFKAWEKFTKAQSAIKTQGFIILKVDEKTMLDRLHTRIKTSTESRKDDNIVSFFKRIETFKADTADVLDFAQKHYPFLELDSSHPPEEIVKTFLAKSSFFHT